MADFLQRIERIFSMDDGVWARHASPWSMWMCPHPAASGAG